PVGRDGTERRQFMAARSGVKGMRITPKGAVDPIPSRNDASPPRDLPRAHIEAFVPDELRWVDRALASLARGKTPIRALVIRVEYTTTGSQRKKAERVAEQY